MGTGSLGGMVCNVANWCDLGGRLTSEGRVGGRKLG
jgi:hypothetical protein